MVSMYRDTGNCKNKNSSAKKKKQANKHNNTETNSIYMNQNLSKVNNKIIYRYLGFRSTKKIIKQSAQTPFISFFYFTVLN